MLRSRNHWPPNGWVYFQAETGWSSESWHGFNETVIAIIAHRQANPRFNLSTDRAVVEQQLENYHVARLRQLPGGDAFLIENSPEPPPGSFQLRPPPQFRAGAATAVKKLGAGVGLVRDWLGDGLHPVDQSTAESRASVCVRCPLNKPAEGSQKLLGAAADGIHLLMEVRANMKLATSKDVALHICQACLCSLPLKVWADSKHISAHTSKEVLDALWGECWIRKEIASKAQAA